MFNTRNKITILFLICFSLTVFSQTKEEKKQAQAEKKEWSKKLKELNPLDYKALLESKSSLEAEKKDLEWKMKDIASQLTLKEQLISALQLENESLKATTIQAAANPTPVNNSTKEPSKPTSNEAISSKINTQGVIFKVQIGAFKNKDLSKYFENNKNFSGDTDSDGTKKYTIGFFNEYWEADNFKKYIREMGVKDAWIVPYKGNQRLKIKDVLEGVIE